jgi:hypothetical protein
VGTDLDVKTTALDRPRKENPAVEAVRIGYKKLEKRDLGIVKAMNRFAELPTRREDPDGKRFAELFALSDEDLAKEGWESRKELRMAYYGTLPKSQWPASMQSAHERVGMRLRKQAQAPQKNTFNLNVVSIPAPRKPDESKIITIEAKDEPEF